VFDSRRRRAPIRNTRCYEKMKKYEKSGADTVRSGPLSDKKRRKCTERSVLHSLVHIPLPTFNFFIIYDKQMSAHMTDFNNLSALSLLRST